MTAASDFIEQIEKKTRQQINDNDRDSLADANGLFTWCRVIGQEQARKQMLAGMPRVGMSPDDIKALME